MVSKNPMQPSGVALLKKKRTSETSEKTVSHSERESAG
jgi:hypothetical protein